MSLRLLEDYVPAHFVRAYDFFPSLPNDKNAFPQVYTTISVCGHLRLYGLRLAVINVSEFMFLN